MRHVESIDGNYIVYEDGSVYSKITKRFLNPTLSPNGYLMYSNSLGSVHRLVAKSFISEIPEGMVVNHKDGNKLNNSVDNLEIITHSENVIHAYRNGLIKPMNGEKNHRSKITNEQYVEIAKCFKNYETNEQIAKKYNLHPRYVSLLRHGHRWYGLYIKYGPYPLVAKDSLSKYTKKYKRFLELKDKHSNKEISDILEVDPSTVSRWRSGGTRSK